MPRTYQLYSVKNINYNMSMTQKELIEELRKDVDGIKVELAELKDLKPATVSPVVPESTASPQNSNFPKYPIPPDFVAVVDEVLNKDFGIELEPLSDSPAFKLSIVVPEKYSNTPKEKRAGRDERVKVLPFSDGANGVRLWAEKVYENLGKETQFRITEDRPFANRPL